MTKIKENPKANFKIHGNQLYVTRPSTLWKIIQENKISKGKKLVLLQIIFFTLLTTPLQWLQRLVLHRKLKKINLSENAPVFILGHWRSGTTHLHYTLAKNPKFTYITNFQSFFFNIILSVGWLDRLLSPFMPKVRPQDNMEVDTLAPQEEEQVLANITNTSGVHGFYFPKNRSYFRKYNLFQGISKKEYSTWKKYYLYVVKLISYLGGQDKKVLLKNPNNTARIKQLLELFPNARFIYIHRNPYQVYLSTKHLHRAVLRSQRLQNITKEEEDDLIIQNYSTLIKGYLDSKHLIPEGNLFEIAFDDLGKENELDNWEKIYQLLKLDNWNEMKPIIKDYLDSKKSYKKNKFVEIEPILVEKIEKELAFVFKEYGYEKKYYDTALKLNQK